MTDKEKKELDLFKEWWLSSGNLDIDNRLEVAEEAWLAAIRSLTERLSINKLKETEAHVLDTLKSDLDKNIKITYCGKIADELCFKDAESMICELRLKGCLKPCSECKKSILKLL